MAQPLVYQYLDYRNYLKDLFDHVRKSQRKTARVLFQEAGFKSLGHFYLLTAGKTHLNEKKLEAVAKAWGVDPKHYPYLLKLREFCSTKSLSQKTELYRELERMRAALKVRILNSSELELLSHWATIPLLEALGTRMNNASVSQWAKALKVKSSQIEEMLGLFVRLGLAHADGASFRRSPEAFEMYIEKSSKAIRRLHAEFIERAFQSIEGAPEDERILMTLSLPLKASQLKDIRKFGEEFLQRLNREQDAGMEADSIYQFNLQVFPILKRSNLS